MKRRAHDARPFWELSMRRHSFAVFLCAALVPIACAQSPTDSSAMQPYEARAVEVSGKVTRTLDQQPWALSKGERVPVRQVITTGSDGMASFSVAGGSGFDLFGNSKVIFRQNTARAGDLLDVISGRVRVRLRPAAGQLQQRVFTPIAAISATSPALISVAVDEDTNVRVDVLEGEVRVQHLLLPRNEATLVRAVDAILIERNQQLSRRVDRGSLYRYTVKPLHDLWTAVTPKGTHAGEPVEGNKWLSERLTATF